MRSCRSRTAIGSSSGRRSTLSCRARRCSGEKKGHRACGLSLSFLQVGGKELGCLALSFVVDLGVVSERQVELLAELGGFGVRKCVHGTGILDDPVIGLRRVEILLDR